MTEARIFYFVPSYDGNIHGDVWAGYESAITQTTKKLAVHKQVISSSALTGCFNRGWLSCLTFNRMVERGEKPGARKFTHFLMNHADIGVVPGTAWLDVMLDMMEAHDLDVLSANSPMKLSVESEEVETTTAIMDGEGEIRRLKLKELADLPDPVTPAITKERFGTDRLLINTGLMLVKLEKINPTKHYFGVENRIFETEKGWYYHFLSEDWKFSLMLLNTGLKYGATRSVRLNHFGSCAWGNQYEKAELSKV